MTAPAAPRLGLRANLPQFTLLVVVNALVGGTVGQERSVLPLLAEHEFGIAATTTSLTFLVAFGMVKAVTNLVAGTLADRYGRKRVLVAGWVVGLPVPLLVIVAPDWSWVVAANVLLGVNQGLTWTSTVVMKIDLAGPARRGLAMGLNEAAGYGAVAATALATGALAESYGLRPAPFLLGLAYVVLGLALSTAAVRDTTAHAALEAGAFPAQGHLVRSGWGSAIRCSVTDRTLLATSQAGLVNNLNDALAWGLLPIFFAAHGHSVAAVGVLAAIPPAVWAVGQIPAGAWSDRVGRKSLIAAGMLIQSAGLALYAAATGAVAWTLAGVLLGGGTALAYPTLLAAVSDVAGPATRGAAIGAYRMWRDLGIAVGALVVGASADLISDRGAIWLVAVITAASGLWVAVVMVEGRTGE